MDELDRITTLEGPAFSGKTVLLRTISQNLKNKIGTIPEGSEYVDRDNNSFNFDMFSSSEAKKSLYFCLEVEKRRSQDAINLLKFSEFVLMDRSIISNLLFYQLLVDRNKSHSEYFGTFLNFALSAFYLEVQRGNILLPRKLALLTVDSRQTFEKRTSDRISHTAFMSEWDVYQQSVKIYDQIAFNHYNPQSVVRLTSDNTSNNQQNLSNKLCRFVFERNNTPIDIKSPFTNFLGIKRPTIETEAKKGDEFLEAKNIAGKAMEKALRKL